MIIASAIKFYYQEDKEHKFPQIWTGLRHADIFERMFKMGVEYDKDNHVQGFIDEQNKFYDRYDAMDIAVARNQISWEFYMNNRQLYSEDIWPEE